MATVRAVLFDFGGTLYDYGTLEPAERESLVELARSAGINAEPQAIQRAHRDAIRRAFHQYLPRRFYMHRDLFRDAVIGMLEAFGVAPDSRLLDGYHAAQWERHARDFALREGVVETLQSLRGRGVHLGIVSNIDDDQLAHLLALAPLQRHFDSILSSEQAQSCKPDHRIYDLALRRAPAANQRKRCSWVTRSPKTSPAPTKWVYAPCCCGIAPTVTRPQPSRGRVTSSGVYRSCWRWCDHTEASSSSGGGFENVQPDM